MYTPPAFAVDDLPTLHDFIQAHSFATLISGGSESFEVTHVPLLLDRSIGECGQLIGHLAKANPQWKSAEGNRVLAIFHGPHAYVSPSWYQEQNVVPTWNYIAVHVHGTLRLQNDPSVVKRIVEDYVTEYESAMPIPWDMKSADETFVDNLTQAIVGFTIDIDRIEGKWKLSQNHSEERRQGVIEGLRKRENGDDVAIAELMEQQLNQT